MLQPCTSYHSGIPLYTVVFLGKYPFHGYSPITFMGICICCRDKELMKRGKVMKYEWYQMNPTPIPYQHDYSHPGMMREFKYGHGGGQHGNHGKPGHGGGHYGKPGHGGGHGKPGHGSYGGFQGGLPFLGGLAGGLLAGTLLNSPNNYPYYPYPNYGYYPGYPPQPYPPYQNYPNYPGYQNPPYGGYY